MASENVYDKEGRMTDGKVLDIPTNSHHSDKIYIWFMVGELPHSLAAPAAAPRVFSE